MGGAKSKKVDTEVDENDAVNRNKVEESLPQTSYLDDDDFGDAPEFLVCPITQEVMEDPVITSDGHTFERSAIEAWLGNNNTNPMTGGEITSKALTPNFALRDACAAYKAKQPGNADSIRRYKSAVSALDSSKNSNNNVQDQPSKFFSSLPTKTEVKTTFKSNKITNNSYVNNILDPISSKTRNYYDNTTSTTSSSTFINQNDSNNSGNFAPSNVNNQVIEFATSESSEKCGLCEKTATSKSKIGSDWIKVCEDCSLMVSQQSQVAGTSNVTRHNSSFRPLSINDATSHNMEFKSSKHNTSANKYAVRINNNTIGRPSDNGKVCCFHCQINEATTRGKIANEFQPLCNNCFANLSYLKQSENKNKNFKKVSRLAPTSIEFKGSPKNSTSSSTSNNYYFDGNGYENQVALSRRHTINTSPKSTSNHTGNYINPRLSPPRKSSLQEESFKRLKETENNEWKQTTYTQNGRFDVAAANNLTDAINKKYR
jgi:hypothetical protein